MHVYIDETLFLYTDILLTFILLHTVGRMWTIQITDNCLHYENWISWLIVYLTRLFIIIIFTYRYNKINDYLRSFSQVVSTFLRSCGVARRSLSTWHIFFYRMAMFQIQEVVSVVLPFGASIFFPLFLQNI
jgi:hypothetical protein